MDYEHKGIAKEGRFETEEPLSRTPEHRRNWEPFFRLTRRLEIPEDFLQERNDVPPQTRTLFEDRNS